MMDRSLNQKADFIEIRLPVPWGEINGYWYGNRKVRPLLALHGWLDNLGTFNTLIPLLPKHIGVLCFDWPGHGRSSKFPKGCPYHAMDFVGVLWRIIKAYNWDKVSILGHSMGAIVGIIFTSLYPQRVDMLICIDIVRVRFRTPSANVDLLRHFIERFEIEDERLDNVSLSEPPAYSYEELENVLYNGTNGSVLRENTKHLLDRNVKKSKLYPDKYYFSRDGRLKVYHELLINESLSNAMSLRIKNVPFCSIKGSESSYITEANEGEIIRSLSQVNPLFEFHVVKGTHHIHLNNAAEVAAVVVPFISHYRPPLLEKWSVDELEENSDSKSSPTPGTSINQYQKHKSKL